MTDPVIADELRYQAKLSEAEAFDDWVSETADSLADDWYTEYCISGRVDYLDWNAAEIQFRMDKSRVDAFTLLRNEAHKTVRAYPEDYKPEPDYSEM